MNAIVVAQHGGPEVLALVNRRPPHPGPSQVLIRVHAASVNFADIKARYGTYHGGSQPPFVPGLDAAGMIQEVGSEVHGLEPGQRVITFPTEGSYAEYIVADASLTFPVPEAVDDDTAAACPLVSFTAFKLLVDVARLVRGETVLVHAAAGGVGTTAIQLAKVLGARLVIGTVGNPTKAGAATAAGADAVISYEDGRFAERVRDLTEGHGVDVILDSVAGPVTDESMRCLAPFGRLVNFGNASGETGTVRTVDLHSTCRAVLGFSLGTLRKERPDLLRHTATEVLTLLKERRLNIQIGRRFPLAQAADAHRWLESRNSTGKILLIVGGSRDIGADAGGL